MTSWIVQEGHVDWNIVVLVLGALVVAFAGYFTHTVLRRSGGTMEASVDREGMRFKITAAERNLAAGDAGVAGAQRGLRAEEEKAGESLRDVSEVRPARVLWVDDDPGGNVHERRMLERLHLDIDLARSTDEALEYLVGRSYQLIITDLTRPGPAGEPDRRAGLELLRFLAEAPGVPPVLVYAGAVDDRASEAMRHGARTVTNTPSGLLRAVIEILAP